MVGGTPLLALDLLVRGRKLRVWAKDESRNLTGSIKDRMALFILERAWREGAWRPGEEIAEATSGNTGIAFASLGRRFDSPVRIFMPDWMSNERKLLLTSLGATLVPVSREEGGFVGSIRLADEWARTNPRVFRPQQFDNPANVEAHRVGTGPELATQLEWAGVRPTAFVAGVGTGGTVMGVGAALREHFGPLAVHPLEPANSPTLRTGAREGTHRIQGISDEFIPAILELDTLARVVDVWDGDAILMAQALARSTGLGFGISSGANLVGAVQVALEQGPGAAVTTVFADCSRKYLSGPLGAIEAPKPGYLAPQIEITGFEILR
ncbi:MAG: PLP-dependent cysteine synthase family protein [Planctomycetes bacterium]|nr:PLP-dependent cysteine synthase family protein [Planctomycetota bacterium]